MEAGLPFDAVGSFGRRKKNTQGQSFWDSNVGEAKIMAVIQSMIGVHYYSTLCDRMRLCDIM